MPEDVKDQNPSKEASVDDDGKSWEVSSLFLTAIQTTRSEPPCPAIRGLFGNFALNNNSFALPILRIEDMFDKRPTTNSGSESD
jgi:hypothetical protein